MPRPEAALPQSENKQLEAVIRGFANHHRIALLRLLADQPGLTLDACAKALDMNVKTASEHLRRLALADMVDKDQDGREVHHTLTDRGQAAYAFIQAMRQDAS